MGTKITVPIAAENSNQAGKQITSAKAAGAEMLELRTDYLKNLDVDLVRNLILEVKSGKRKKMPIIVTCRDTRQGGVIAYPDRLRVDVLVAALKAGAEFIDFEYDKFLSSENQERIRRALSQAPNSRLILSAHNFEAKFPNIAKLYRHIHTLNPAAIPKLVYKANHINDCFEAFDLLHKTSGERIVFCMGEDGLISRIIAKKLGSLVTFASIDEKTATAPGQLTIEHFKKLYRFDSIDTETKLFGVIADPVAHSLSPAIHNRCFAQRDMNNVYLPLLVKGGREKFESFLNGIILRKWLSFRGFSVTIPHKQNALDFVRKNHGNIQPLAEKIGAANTIIIGPNDGLHAYNTDYAAAMDAITSKLKITKTKLAGFNVAVIGAGGVSRAIVAGLSDIGAKITIYNRTEEKGKKLADEFKCDSVSLDDLPNLQANLLINCTSIGMHPYAGATLLSKKHLSKDMAVFDTIYNPVQTLLLKQAGEKGAKTIDGLTMFINQAAAQFKLFTGKNADTKLMQRTISNCMRS